MDSLESVELLADFEMRLQRMNPADESMIRETVSEIAKDCPLHVFTQIAYCVLGIRKAELRRAGEGN